MEFTFDNSSTQNVTMAYGSGIRAVFTKYTKDEYIESIILLTIFQNRNETVVNCLTDVQNATELFLYEPSGILRLMLYTILCMWFHC